LILSDRHLFRPLAAILNFTVFYNDCMNIFVSNLAGPATGRQMETLFSEFGVVHSAIIIQHENRQKLDNYCWLVMPEQSDAEHAIRDLDKTLFMHQTIAVEQAIFALHGS
jgi:RNA recognition motif-containing protein